MQKNRWSRVFFYNKASIQVQVTFQTELIDVNVADGSHVAQNGENDESSQQAGGQVDGTCQHRVAECIMAPFSLEPFK